MTDSLNFIELISNASIVVQVVMFILLLTSILAWVIIFRLSSSLSSAKKHDEYFNHWFWSGKDIYDLFQSIKTVQEKQGLAALFHEGFEEYLKLCDNNQKKQALEHPLSSDMPVIEKKLRVCLGREQQMLESGLSTLASIGSVSPYIGLFGTVWGIMNAFLGLSMTDQASLSSVAPGIAEALIATAMGLFAAIPAVLAYNHFTAKTVNLYDIRALFCDELTGLMERNHSVFSNRWQTDNSQL